MNLQYFKQLFNLHNLYTLCSLIFQLVKKPKKKVQRKIIFGIILMKLKNKKKTLKQPSEIFTIFDGNIILEIRVKSCH